MVSWHDASRILIGAAVGTLLLVPAHGSAQDSLSVSCAAVFFRSPLEDLIRCAEQGSVGAADFLAGRYDTPPAGVSPNHVEAARWLRVVADQEGGSHWGT